MFMLLKAMAVAQLQSPHVVQILDYGIHEEQPFIAMELLEGATLDYKDGLEQSGETPPTTERS